ncbi:hypothetical protein HPCU_03210 [Helicobacter pylori Cuz20]|uniref:Uncharacterized protein n=2 Tax=Helicobacter pylori TaxID=210 RepID=A0A0E0WAX8_HELPX|nr:hypothetical protein HPSH_03930 [Helicobacter pylori Shi470]ADO03808.1 hypothetical protein HPCU_03210 [Helicobacter pylori Cuz20]ADO05508.1 hypothetical protein HPSAT_03860 [Helicobacter pylori Sat464]AFH97719.1 hypothetical protein HPSH417_02830 [Helicobacter pylori Shi417]AFH99304.1 hypothetical protein HPSH169_03030 [Helicobacter pylori Shi169]AFI01018.1 hypothetical protein HPSH112_04085 [Helicobacter pylori Shi112]
MLKKACYNFRQILIAKALTAFSTKENEWLK